MLMEKPWNSVGVLSGPKRLEKRKNHQPPTRKAPHPGECGLNIQYCYFRVCSKGNPDPRC
jgi:hypothetical protein